MTTTLRLVVDQLVAPIPGAIGRYTRDLGRAIIQAAPRDCQVEGIVSSSPPEDYQRIEAELPGLAGLYKTSLARRELAAAWQLGLTTSPGGGMIHGTSLFAPLRKHDRALGDQTVVTVHDVLAWTHPESLSTTAIAWQRGMMKRARKHAEAVVVPTHALAEQLAERVDFGDRVHVVGSAPQSGLHVGPDSLARAERLGLGQDYLVVPGTLEPRKGLVDVLEALGRAGAPDIPIVVLGPSSWGDQHLVTVAEEHGVRANRVRALDGLDVEDLAVVIAGAAAYVAPARDEADGAALIDALSLGAPVVHSATDTHTEIAAGAGLSVEIGVGDGFAERLAGAITAVVEDQELARLLSTAGQDRARAFSWRDAADQVWRLHAEL